MTNVKAKARALAESTADSFSFDRYQNWYAVALMLLQKGLSELEAEAILRSKWTRWASDASGKPYGRATSTDLAKFMGSVKNAAAEIKALTAETFPSRFDNYGDGNVEETKGRHVTEYEDADLRPEELAQKRRAEAEEHDKKMLIFAQGDEEDAQRDALRTFMTKGLKAQKAVDALTFKNGTVVAKVKANVVEITQQGDSVVFSLNCAGALHANLIAKAIADGVVSFDSRCI